MWYAPVMSDVSMMTLRIDTLAVEAILLLEKHDIELQLLEYFKHGPRLGVYDGLEVFGRWGRGHNEHTLELFCHWHRLTSSAAAG